MKSIVLSLNMAEYVKDFVQIVTKYNYDMDLRCGRYVVDAKSILGDRKSTRLNSSHM